MPAQTGYLDTLKSVAGKVFTYLASITLTGADGKTITCTQDTSLDEAVAMSSKQAKTLTIAGDGTAGRVLRMAFININDGTNAGTIKITMISEWNGDAHEVEDNIAKGATSASGFYSVSAGGNIITILDAAITGSVVGAAHTGLFKDSNHATFAQVRLNKSGGGILMLLCDAAGNDVDITNFTTGTITIKFLYVTSA